MGDPMSPQGRLFLVLWPSWVRRQHACVLTVLSCVLPLRLAPACPAELLVALPAGEGEKETDQ